MTCDEFRDHNKSFKHLSSLTRAVRALCVVHLKQCPKCLAFINSLRPTSLEEARACTDGIKLAKSDDKDPEFREVVDKCS